MEINRKNIIVAVMLTAIILIVAVFYLYIVRMFPREYDNEITAASEAYGLDDDLIRAVIWTESKFNEDAVSPKGASGLMQLMPGTRKEQSEVSGVVADGSPLSEIMLGAGYLARMLAATGDTDTALMAYNAGLASVKRWDEPYAESVEYVKRVKLARRIYAYLR